MNPSEPRLSHRAAVRRLASAQKSNRGAAGYSRWVNRPVGRQLAALGYVHGWSANQVSALGAVFTLGAITAIALVRPTWPMAVAVTAALVIGYALDSADGQVARLRGTGSPAGEWLDHVLDAVKIAVFHVAVAVSWFRFAHLTHAAWLLVPLAFAAAHSVFFFTLVLTDMLRRLDRVAHGETGETTARVRPQEDAGVLRSLVVLPNDYGVFCLVMVLLPAHGAFTVAYTTLAVANVALVLLACVRWFRELNRLAATRSA